MGDGGWWGMTNLSKAFDCLRNELLMAKLDAYGFDIKSVKLIQQYLSNRKQRVKVGNAYSSWKEIFENFFKIHILFSGNGNISCYIDDHIIISGNKKDLLGIILDLKLSFDDHINNLCEKTSQKLNALVRITPYMCLEKRETVMKGYVISQFGYCPLVWMFYSRGLNNKIKCFALNSVKNNMQ